MSLVDAFDLLLVLYLGLTLVSLARLRAATLVVAANQLPPLRALSHAAEFGQPRSQSFLPASVYSQDNLTIAAALFVVQLVLLAVCVFWPEPRKQVAAQRELPAVPLWLRWVLAAYFVAVTLSSRTIITHHYIDPERLLFGLNLSGFHALLASLALYELVRRVRLRILKPLTAFLLLFGLFFATDYLKGSTGLASGFLVTGALLFVREEPARARRWLFLSAAAVTAVLLALAVRGLRNTLYSQGFEAVSGFTRALGAQEGSVARDAEGLEISGNGVQYAAHVLECISLYEAGISRQWRSIYRPLEYTFKPSFLVEPLGLERPREAAWELGDYYVGGGGTFVLGELYWNGGYPCLLIVLSAIFWFCWRCDTGARSSGLWLLLLCEFAPNVLQGIGYGFAQTSRGALNGALVLGVRWAWLRLTARRGGAAPPAEQKPPPARPRTEPA